MDASVEKDMEQSEMMSDQEKKNLAHDVMENVGEPTDVAHSAEAEDANTDVKDDLPFGLKKRLGMQEKRHQKEMRAMQAQLQAMQSHLGSQQQSPDSSQAMNPYTNQPIQPGSVEDQIHRAVNMALQAKDQQEAKMKQAEKAAHVQKQYQNLQKNLDKGSDKYDDFDEVVRSPDVPFTDAMRDAALLIPNPEDVLYKLGKNQDELKRISNLHPLDQAKEIVQLSHALVAGNGGKTQQQPRPIGQIKNTPIASQMISDKTPVSEIRARMKASWK